MPRNHAPDRPPLSWGVQLLRLTAFPAPSSDFANQNWWYELVGEAPEKRTAQPKSGIQIDEGDYGSGRLILIVNPVRVEWQYVIKDDPSSEVDKPLTLGTFSDAVEKIRELAHRWFELESSPNLVRLAFGSALLQPVSSLAASYELLSSYLPFDLNSQDSSDFLYRINRWRESQSGISKLRINRLSTWSAAQIHHLLFSITLGQAQTPSTRLANAIYACTLELDINTAADFEGELKLDLLPALFDELVELGKEIAQEGDIP